MLAGPLIREPEVVLQKDDQALWRPPACTSLDRSATMQGDRMAFLLPTGTRVRSGRDSDYQTRVVCTGRDCMQLGWGAMWRFGLPPSLPSGLRSLAERDVSCGLPLSLPSGLKSLAQQDVSYRPEIRLNGVEYRGIRSDGTFWRWVGVFGETIKYDHASRNSAKFFDRIIDSLCWNQK